MFSAASALLLIGSASAQGFICPPGSVHPTGVKAGAQCGGFCNMIGECATGLTCADAPDSSPMGGMVTGAGSIGMCVTGAPPPPPAPLGPIGCSGCEEPDAIDADTLAAAHHAVALIDAQSNALYASQLVQIVPGTPEEQVVAGTRYDMDIDTAFSTCHNLGDGTPVDGSVCPTTPGSSIQRYHISLVFASWQSPQYTLISFNPVPGNFGVVPSSGGAKAPAPPPAVVHTGHDCDDGSIQECMVMIMCPPGTLSAVKEGCTACVDPSTCEAATGH